MKNITKNFMLLFSVATLLIQPITAQKKYNEASTGNPIVPGYYADPTVRKFGDTYYMYATTDGTGGGKGPSQVWVSKDFVNWTMLEMNWPTTPFIWAPDVVEKNGKYYYYYSEPCIVYGGVADTPLGPWKNLNEDGTPIIENGSIKDIITLDGQMFTDDDGKMYIYFGTWGIYKNSGCGVYQVAEDMKTMSNPVLIPNTDIKDFFEAPYVIKKDGIYYFTYSAGSCHDETYRVQYATSTEGPCGPFKFQDNNPILTTNADGTVHGPGHHSLLEHENEWYIVYHRHDNPHSGGGMFRQLAADKMEFGAPGIIKNVVPTHDGIGFLAESVNPFPNIALNRPVKVSSYVDEDYKPAYAVDDNNGTCWFPSDTNGDYWMEVDLGEEKNIRKIETDFRYGTLVYQYKIEASKDGKDWVTFSDKTANLQSGSPMTDFGNMSARYLKITVTGEESFGFSGIWRFRVFEDAKCDLPQLLVSLTAEDLVTGEIVAWKNNRGMYGKGFSGNASVKMIDGKKVVVGTMLSDFIMANSTLAKGNPYTIAAEVYQNGTWKHITFVNDGKKETTYIDGKEVKKSTLKPIIKAGERIEIGIGEKAIIKGEISSLRIYSRALFPAEIEYIRSEKPRKIRIAERGQKGAVLHVDAADIPLGTSVTQLKNKGFMQGSLKAEGVAPIVDMIHGKKALLFNGGEILVSDFVTPETLSANSSYTVSAWVFNPEIDKNEAILEWANLQKRDHRGSVENEMKLFGFGSEANNGVMTHVNYGDMGFAKESLPEAGKWHNITVTFDGLVERVYVNGVLNNSEMKISFSTRNCKLYLGNNSDRNQPFSGALASVKLYNTCLTVDEIKSEVNKTSEEPIVLNVTSSKLIPGTITTWENRAAWLGNFTSNKLGVNVGDVDGKIALVLNGKSTLSYPVNASQLKDGLSMVIAFNNPKIENGETLFSYKETIGKTLISLSQTKKGGVLKIGDSEFTVNEMPVVSAWEQMTLAINKSTVKLYVGNKLVMSQDLDGFNLSDGEIILGGNGKKLYSGAVSDFTLYNKMLSDREVQAGYELWNNSKNLFTESVGYQLSPIMVSSSMIRMSAKKPSFSTPVEYLFTKYEDGKIIETSGWSLDNEYVLSNVTSGKKYQFSVRMKDFFGNITPESEKFEVNTDNIPALFNPVANGVVDLIQNAKDAGWDGFYVANGVEHLTASQNGNVLKLGSTQTGYDGFNKNGPFAYKEVKGDFVAQVLLSDASGEKERKSHGFNDYGIIASLPIVEDKAKLNFISSSVFPHYNVGNLWTNMVNNARPQGNNQSGWNSYRYLQIERSGNTIYLRYSEDGKNWIMFEKFVREDLAGKPMWVGIYHSTYSDFVGYGEFTDFKLWER